MNNEILMQILKSQNELIKDLTTRLEKVEAGGKSPKKEVEPPTKEELDEVMKQILI